jgi:hypothetical protein
MAKRLKGEGSVYRRKDGRWAASITLENGQRKTAYCKSKQEANPIRSVCDSFKKWNEDCRLI